MLGRLKPLFWFLGILLALEFGARIYLFSKIPEDSKPSGLQAVKIFLTQGSYTCEFRGQQYSFYKPKNVFRILAVGGSTTAGIRGDEETWTYKLAAKLNQNSGTTRYEVINIAECGISSPQELYYVKSQIYLNPDLVIVYDGYNDLVGSNADSAAYLLTASKVRSVMEKPNNVQTIRSFLYRKSALVNRAGIYLYRFKNFINSQIIEKKWLGLGRQSKIRMFQNVEWYASQPFMMSELESVKESVINKSYQKKVKLKIGKLVMEYDLDQLTGNDTSVDLFPEVYRYHLEELAELLNEKSIRGLFIYQPFMAEKHARLAGVLNKDDLAGYSNFNIESDRDFVAKNAGRKQIVRDVAERKKMHFYDAQDVFDNVPTPQVYVDNCHNTDYGLDLLAGRIQEVLTKTPGLISQP